MCGTFKHAFTGTEDILASHRALRLLDSSHISLPLVDMNEYKDGVNHSHKKRNRYRIIILLSWLST